MRRRGRRQRMLGLRSVTLASHGGGMYVPLSTGVDPALGSGIFSFFLINSVYMPAISASFTEWKWMQRVFTLLAIADGNSCFVLAQAIIVLLTCLRAVRRGEGDHNMYLPGSLKMREHMLPHTAQAETSKSRHPPPSIIQLTSVFNCPAGMSTIWIAEIVPSLPPMSTPKPSPVQFVSSFSPPPLKRWQPTFPEKQCQRS